MTRSTVMTLFLLALVLIVIGAGTIMFSTGSPAVIDPTIIGGFSIVAGIVVLGIALAGTGQKSSAEQYAESKKNGIYYQ